MDCPAPIVRHGAGAAPTVERQADGTFVVVANGYIVSRPFASNAEAWRALDRMEGDPVSKAELKSEWLWSKIVSETQ